MATIEELSRRISAKALWEEERKRGVRASCVRKLHIASWLPWEVLEHLASEAE